MTTQGCTCLAEDDGRIMSSLHDLEIPPFASIFQARDLSCLACNLCLANARKSLLGELLLLHTALSPLEGTVDVRRFVTGLLQAGPSVASKISSSSEMQLFSPTWHLHSGGNRGGSSVEQPSDRLCCLIFLFPPHPLAAFLFGNGSTEGFMPDCCVGCGGVSSTCSEDPLCSHCLHMCAHFEESRKQRGGEVCSGNLLQLLHTETLPAGKGALLCQKPMETKHECGQKSCKLLGPCSFFPFP